MEQESDGVDSGNGTSKTAAARLATVDDEAMPCGVVEPAASQDNKETFWLDGMVNCFTTIFSVFGLEDDKTTLNNNWEVPYSSITEMVNIGAGAQGVVCSGMFRGELVAVKKLKEQTESNFKHLRKLNHENIVRFKGVCSQPPYYCVIMEYCKYGPLFNFLHSGVAFLPKQILKWAQEIAHGMAYLHSNKIVHRDLKSPNILVSDNLVVKVSDFGTSRVWDDVSTIMSFAGTVAWMAPEIIRHEPCSDKVDVWSYGVVLWELITQEIPYRNLESHAIMWGVGNNTLTLPVPPSFPESLQLLMKQCWNRVARNRPSFKFIESHLEIAGEELTCLNSTEFDATQANWRKEVTSSLQEMYKRTDSGGGDSDAAEARRRREETRCVRDLRQVYEQQVSRANELYMEVCATRLQLEQRERTIAKREKALNGCRCGVAFRKNIKQLCRVSSSSSDGVKAPLVNFKQVLQEVGISSRKKLQAQKQPDKTSAQIVTDCQVHAPLTNNNKKCSEQMTGNAKESNCDSICNNNIIAPNTSLEMKDTIIEYNGNAQVANTRQIETALIHHLNGNDIV